jgi:hypothetical protein
VRVSLADELKIEVSDWCKKHYNIDPLTCSREDKEVIRPFLVFHGTQKRKRSKGRHWINKLQDSFDTYQKIKLTDDSNKVVVITDIRYDEFYNDEVGWLRGELGGKLIHITQYRNGSPKAPANTEEERNEPRLINKSDFRIEWKYLENGQTNELMPHIHDFMSWYSADNEK